jgi:PAS domain-containing protein
MAEKGFWPLYEGKHIEQFLVDIKPIERWVSLEACGNKYGQPPDPGPKLVFRDIASNTNERTCIAAVLPERSCAGNSLPIITGDLPPDSMAAVLNALTFDFSVRLRTVGTHLNFTYVERFAVLPPNMTRSLPTLPTESVAATEASHIGDLPESWDRIWLVNRAVAEAYGLTPDDFEYILSTFPVFARKRPAFYAYLQERVQEWKREVEEARVYAIPAAGLARAAGTSVRQPSAPEPFRQAAVLAWVVHKLHSPGYPVSRFRAQKMLYLIEAITETGLFTEFRKQAAGPYDPSLRYKGPEDIAVRQRGWLVQPDDSHFEPGPNIEEALRYASRYIDTELAELVLEEFRTFKDGTLERWTTVHLAAVELLRQGQPVTPETVEAYIESVPEWQLKLSRDEFTSGRIADALQGLEKLGFIPRGGRTP